MDGMLPPRRGSSANGRRVQPSLLNKTRAADAAAIDQSADGPQPAAGAGADAQTATPKSQLTNFQPLTPASLARQGQASTDNGHLRAEESIDLSDETAASDRQLGATALAGKEAGNGDADATDPVGADAKPPRRSPVQWFKGLPKKKKVLVIVIALVLLTAIGAGIYFVFIKADKPVQSVQKKPAVVKHDPPKPTTVPSTLTGLPVDPSVNDRNLVGVMVENSTDARPQSGLDQAGVVFEAIAEGGITRFLALFQDQQPDYLGPVRSVRPYYIQWASGFDAPIAHVGGSGEALQDMKSWNIKDLDQFSGGSYFQRITGRPAPHNVYTSYANLNAYEQKLGYSSNKFTSFSRVATAGKAVAAPTAKSIDLTLSGYYFNVHYDFDASTNAYKRSEGNAPHMVVNAAGAQTQLAPKVVVALVMPYGLEADGLHSEYGTIGSGQAYIFQDGTAIQATWHKASRTDQFTFTDADNKPVALEQGQTWLTAVNKTSQVGYTP